MQNGKCQMKNGATAAERGRRAFAGFIVNFSSP
jgi:hypothetical protein